MGCYGFKPYNSSIFWGWTSRTIPYYFGKLIDTLTMFTYHRWAHLAEIRIQNRQRWGNHSFLSPFLRRKDDFFLGRDNDLPVISSILKRWQHVMRWEEWYQEWPWSPKVIGIPEMGYLLYLLVTYHIWIMITTCNSWHPQVTTLQVTSRYPKCIWTLETEGAMNLCHSCPPTMSFAICFNTWLKLQFAGSKQRPPTRLDRNRN